VLESANFELSNDKELALNSPNLTTVEARNFKLGMQIDHEGH